MNGPVAHRLLLGGIIIVGAISRYALVPYGLPYLFHPDEIAIARETFKFWSSILQGNFTLSTNVFSHCLSLVYGLQYGICRLIGSCTSVADFQRLVLLDHPGLYLSGRLMSATFDLGNIYMTYRLGTVLFSREAGLVAALGYALAAIPIEASTWVKMDSITTFFILLAQIAILHAMRGCLVGGWRMAGFLTGLAVATRINAIPLLASLLVGYCAAPRVRGAGADPSGRERRWKEMVAVVGLATLAYLLLTFQLSETISRLLGQRPLFWTQPYLEIMTAKAVADWGGDQWQSPWLIMADNVWFYAQLVSETIGWPALLGILAGILLVLWRRDPAAKVSLVFPVLYLIPLVVYTAHMSYYVLPILPFLFAYLGLSVKQLVQRFRAAVPSARVFGPATLATVLLTMPTLVSASYVGYMLKGRETDTRILAKHWIESHIPSGETIAIEKFHELPTMAPPLAEDPEENRQKLFATRELGLGSGRAREEQLRSTPATSYVIVNLSPVPTFGPWGKPFENPYDFDLLLRQGVKYVVTGGYIVPEGYATHGVSPKFLHTHFAFHERLGREGKLIASFVPEDKGGALEVVRLLSGFIADPPLRIYEVSGAGQGGEAGRSSIAVAEGESEAARPTKDAERL